jgi:drug/metabolite transporter (DMT)-like permease
MRLKDTIDLIILAVVWGASFLFMRVAGPEFGPFALVEVRVAIAGLFLLPFLLLRSGLAELAANWKALVLLGTLSSALPFVLLVYSTLHITGGFASILNATSPLWAALIAWVWLADRMTVSQVAGLVLGFIGVYILVWDEMSFALIDGVTLAILAALLSSVCYGAAANYTKRYVWRVNPLVLAVGSQLGAAIVLLPGAVLTWPEAPISGTAWMSVIAMGIVSTGLAYILYFRLIASAGPAKAITVTYLVPVFAMLWGALFINETVSLTMAVGCAVILVGTALATGIIKLWRLTPPTIKD